MIQLQISEICDTSSFIKPVSANIASSQIFNHHEVISLMLLPIPISLQMVIELMLLKR